MFLLPVITVILALLIGSTLDNVQGNYSSRYEYMALNIGYGTDLAAFLVILAVKSGRFQKKAKKS